MVAHQQSYTDQGILKFQKGKEKKVTDISMSSTLKTFKVLLKTFVCLNSTIN